MKILKIFFGGPYDDIKSSILNRMDDLEIYLIAILGGRLAEKSQINHPYSAYLAVARNINLYTRNQIILHKNVVTKRNQRRKP